MPRFTRARRGTVPRPRGRLSSGELAAQVRTLQLQAEAVGAREIEQDKPSLFRRVVDLLSRFEFAEAGFVETLAEEGRLGPAFARAGRELFSGIGGLRGEKRGFTEVLERVGVGELGSLGDVIPQLEGTFFDFTGRGALGLTLAIAADPITYITAGGAAIAVKGPRAVGFAGRVVQTPEAFRFSRPGLRQAGRELKPLQAAIQQGRLPAEVSVRAKELFKKDLLEEEAFEKLLVSAKELFKTEKAKARVTKAFTGRPSILTRAETKKVRQLLRRGGTDTNQSISELIKDNIQREVAVLTRNGVTNPVTLNKAAQVARLVAEERVLAAAVSDPRLLVQRGMRFMGRPIPGTPQLSLFISGQSQRLVRAIGDVAARTPGGLAAAVVESARGVRSIFDALGSVFKRDFPTRMWAAFNALKQALIDTHSGELMRFQRELLSSAVGQVKPKRFEAFYRGVAFNETAGLSQLERQAVDDFLSITGRFAADEVQRGVLPVERVLDRYWPQFYLNPPSQVDDLLRIRGKAQFRETIGRHRELRAWDNYDDAVRQAKKLGVDLKPMFDPVEVLRRRAANHFDEKYFSQFKQIVEREFGPLPFDVTKALDLTKSHVVASKVLNKIQRQIARGGTPLAFVRKLDPEGRKEFLRRRFEKVGSREELARTRLKYNEFELDFPREGTDIGTAGIVAGPGASDIPLEIRNTLDGMSKQLLQSPEVRGLLRIHDAQLNFFKRLVTIYWPSFIFRNLYSNVGQTFLDIALGALDPRVYRQVLRGVVSKNKDDLLFIARDTNERVTVGMIQQEWEQLGVRTTIGALTEQTGIIPLRGRASILTKLPRTFNKSVENSARLVHYTALRMRGLNPDVAAARMKKFLFDYDNLSRVEKEGFRRAIPFYVWTRKNIELQLKTLVEAPGRQAALLKPLRGREEENDMLVQWKGEALKIRLDRDGRNATMLVGVDLPAGDLSKLWAGSLGKTVRQNLSMIQPLIKAPIELAAGRNFFLNRGLDRTQSAAVGRIIETFPRPMRDFFGFTKRRDAAGRIKYEFDGERFYLFFQSYALSRVVSTADRQFREFVNDEGWSAILLNVITGLRLEDMNLDEEQFRKFLERRSQLREVLIKRGAAREFRRTTLTQAEF